MEWACIMEDQGIAIVLLRPQYKSSSVHTLRELEQRLVEEIDCCTRGLLIDLSETLYSSGEFLNVLLRCQRRARQMKRKFALCRPAPLLRRVLAITRLDSLWQIFQSQQEAIEAMQGRTMTHFKGVSHARLDPETDGEHPH